jgi:hypothetical protein
MRRTMVGLAVACVAAPLVFTSAAAGATVLWSTRLYRIVYRAAPGEVNRVTVKSEFPGDPDSGDQLYMLHSTPRAMLARAANSPCSSSAGVITCHIVNDSESPTIQVFLGDRDDVAAGSADNFFGEAGNDRLNGYTVDGGPGNDLLTGSELTGGLGNDRLTGDGKSDTALYGARTVAVHVDLRRAGPAGQARERDYLYSVENVKTGSGPDVLIGNPAPNTFTAGPGNDTINVAGGGRDVVFCGPGVDGVVADATDRLVGCERVKRS